MIFLNILILLIVFLGSSFLSGFVLTHYGYPPPRKIETREDYLLVAMKLITFTIFVILFLVLLIFFGIDPLSLMDQNG